MALNPYLNFKNNSKEVLYFYRDVFGTAEPDIMYFKDMPADPNNPIPPEMADLVMHAMIMVNGTPIMISDAPEGMAPPITMGNNLAIMYSGTDFNELQGYFDKLKEGGQVVMPFGKVFWGEGYGYLIDKFGIGWHFNVDNPTE